MIDSRDQRSIRATPAERTLSETWRTSVVDANRINSRLTGLWLRLIGPRPLRLSGFNRPSQTQELPESASGPGVYARTNTTNLLVCARNPAQTERAEMAIYGLQTHYPTRAITVAADPAADRTSSLPDEEALSITARLVPTGAGAANFGHFESVSISGGPRRLGNPARTAIPLCVPDLPIILWWLGDLQYDLGMFRDLVESSDRVIVDSAGFGDVARGLSCLSALDSQNGRGSSVLVDMAWLRLLDWRNLIAQFYDAPLHPDAPSAISSVTIGYVVDPEPGQVAGQASALLLVGWLASRLGWRLEDRITRTSAGLRLVYTTRQPYPVVVRLQPIQSRSSTSGIVSVGIGSNGEVKSSYLIDQYDERELITTSTIPGHAPLTRLVVVADRGDSALLERVLQDPGHEPVFDEALAAVAVAISRR